MEKWTKVRVDIFHSSKQPYIDIQAPISHFKSSLYAVWKKETKEMANLYLKGFGLLKPLQIQNSDFLTDEHLSHP